ncbi:MAG: lipoyl(octanoyl) transferase LipB [Alphaproteobacteria bacterium]
MVAVLPDIPSLSRTSPAPPDGPGKPPQTASNAALEWRVSPGLTPYEDAVAAMEARVAAIRDQGAAELVWLLEHPPLYTAGTSADPAELLDAARFPVHQTGRGGRYTYHGPGQRVAYVLLDLKRRGPDVRGYVAKLEDWVIHTLAALEVTGEKREGRIGIWVERPDPIFGKREEKIAAVGVRVRRWVTYHGISLNVAPDLTHFAGIVPCGISEHGVTSLKALGKSADMATVDAALKREFDRIF